tara:strand:- start:732 stop:1142 length:411 start_codon:yes stop_codon:yes gene_type:complete
MAQATRTVGPGTIINDANAPTLQATGNVSADTTGSWVQVDRPCDVQIEMALGTIGGSVTGFDVEIQGADDSSGTNTVSYGRFDTVAHTDDDTTRRMAAHVYKPYMRAVMDHSGSGNVGVTIKVRTTHNQVTDSTTA